MNDDDFESLCRDLFAAEWGAADQLLNGRAGQKQHGVDFYAYDTARGRWRGGQCKVRSGGVLTDSEVRAEVDKAKDFKPTLHDYVIVTTAPSDAKLQQLARELTEENKRQGLFTVTIYGWDQLQEWLDKFPSIRDRYYASLGNAQVASLVQHIETLVLRQRLAGGDDQTTVLHREITRAAEHIQSGQPQITITLLTEIRTERWDRLDARGRYRLLANLGNAHAELQEYRDAANLYLQAADHQPDDPDARALEALAYLYLDERERAFDLAGRIRDEHPSHARACAIWVSSGPVAMPLAQLESAIPAHLQDDAEVALALARRAALADDLELAETYARRAVEKEPRWVGARAELAAIILLREQRARVGRSGATPSADHQERVREAVSLLTAALDSLGSAGKPESVAALHANRAVAFALLEAVDDAAWDLEVAYRRAPTLLDIALQYAAWLFAHGQAGRAIDLLARRVAADPVPELALTLAKMRTRRGEAGDRSEALSLLRSLWPRLSEVAPPMRAEVLDLGVNLLCAEDQHNEALQQVEGLPSEIAPDSSRLALRALIERSAGHVPDAEASARAALRAMNQDTTVEDRRRLAHLATDLGWGEEALRLWKDIVPRTHVTPDTYDLLQCALDCADDAYVVDFCAAMRGNGVWDPVCFEVELRILQRYHNTREAIGLMERYLDVPTNETLAVRTRVRLALTALQIGREDIVARVAANLPPVTAVDAGLGRTVVEILRHGPSPADAMPYAYELWHRFPEALEAFEAVIYAPNLGDGAETTLDAPTSAAPGMAVRYREDDTGQEHWWVIEDRSDARQELGDLPVEHPLAHAMLGKRANDTFSLPGAPFLPRTATILEILPKFVHRWRECIARAPDLFPNQVPVQAIPLPIGPDAPVDLAPIERMLKHKEMAGREALDLYQRSVVPLHLFTAGLVTSVLEAVLSLAAQADQPVRCCAGLGQELVDSQSALRGASAIILDAAAVGSLLVLDEIAIVRGVPIPCVLAEGTLEQVRQLASKAARRSAGAVMATDDGVGFLPADPGEQATWEGRVRRALEELESHCQVEGGIVLARLGRSDRDTLVNAFGQAGAETMALAAMPGQVLWTDDWVAAATMRQALRGQAACTYPVLAWLRESGHINQERFTRAVLRLLVCGYNGVLLSPADIRQALATAEWQADRQPLRQVLDWFGTPLLTNSGIFRLACQAIMLIWQREPRDDRLDHVTLRLLNRLGSRPGGPKVLDALLQGVDALFGLDVVSARRMRELILVWLATGQQGRLALS